MSEEAQTFDGEITIATAELNPTLNQISLATSENVKYNLFSASEIPKVKQNTLIDLAIAQPSMIWVIGTNYGDENIDFKVVLTIDGNEIINDIKEDIVPGNQYGMATMGGIDSAQLTAGAHDCSWFISARRSGTADPFIEYFGDSVTYYCYTATMDAISEEVLIVQNEVEHHWLAWTPEGFVASPVVIEPNKETYFKFRMINPGDEPVRVKIGHKVNTHYETGMLLGGVPIATIDEYAEIEAGGTAEASTVSFTLPEGKAVVSFSVWRTRAIPGTLEESFTVVFEDSPGEHLNLISIPVYDERAKADMLVGYPGFFAVYQFNTSTQEYEAVDVSTPFVPGVGYSIYMNEHAEVPFAGLPYSITAQELVASLKTGWNLIGVGTSPLDIFETGFTALYYTPTGIKQEGITVLEPGKAYFIEK